jgi:hypothetical protein
MPSACTAAVAAGTHSDGRSSSVRLRPAPFDQQLVNSTGRASGFPCGSASAGWQQSAASGASTMQL